MTRRMGGIVGERPPLASGFVALIEYGVLRIGEARITDPPTARPWGAKNMTFFGPDGSSVTFRSFPK